MTPTLPALVTTDDPDWSSFKANDPDWSMRVAGREVRKYCGWHIYPNLQQTATVPVGAYGLIQLPSMWVTDVASVTVHTGPDAHTLDATAYEWFDYGVITPAGWHWNCAGYWSSLPYPPGTATVAFTSGYVEAPDDIKEVTFELTATTMECNAGNVQEIQTPGYRLRTRQPFGATLNDDQKNRLGRYRLPAGT